MRMTTYDDIFVEMLNCYGAFPLRGYITYCIVYMSVCPSVCTLPDRTQERKTVLESCVCHM